MAWPRRAGSRASGGRRLSFGHQELEPDEVESGDELGHGMLDLQAGVDLEEGEGAVGQEQEFDGTGADVADGSGRRHRRGAHFLTHRPG